MSSLANLKLYGVLSSHIDNVWPDVLAFVERALDYSDGKYAIDDIYKALKQTDMQLWIAYDLGRVHAICITNIIVYPQSKRLTILFSAGDEMKNWLHMIKPIMEFGKEQGCESVEIFGRPGWEKALKKFGYQKIHTVVKAIL